MTMAAVTMATVKIDAAATAMAVLAMDAAEKAVIRVTMAVTAMEAVVMDAAAMETRWWDGLKGRLLRVVAWGTCSAPEG